MTIREYLQSPSLEGRAIVARAGSDERGAYLVLDRTLFHPQGGGQRADQGDIDGTPVLFVGNADAEVRHYVASTERWAAGQQVALRVDGATRALHARLHTGGHLIAALVEAAHPGAVGVSGHHWPGEARVEFDALAVADPAAFATQLQALVDQAIADALPVTVQAGATRAVAVGPHRAVPCGGTHCPDTRALAGLRVIGVKAPKGKVRVRYEA